jgi:hypothetical protein
VELPLQIVAEGLPTEITGRLFITTVAEAVSLQFKLVTVTVYVVVTVGVATGLEMFGLLNPADGDQLYADPPLAVRVVEPPIHRVAPPEAEALGTGFTAIKAVPFAVHPFTSAATTVYVVFVVGLTFITELV